MPFCLFCRREYLESRSRAYVQGYCTQRCLRLMAKTMGLRGYSRGPKAARFVMRAGLLADSPPPTETAQEPQ